jgi:hypothetical protein
MTARNDDIGDSLGEDRRRQQEERRHKARRAATDPVAKAAKVLGVRASDDLRRRVEYGRRFVERLKANRIPGVIRTKPERQAMERFYDALLPVRRAARNAELKYHLLFMDFQPEDIDRWIRYSKKVRDETRLGNPAVRGFVGADARARRYAAEAAARKLKRYNQRLNVTRKGKFCALAAIIYGDPSADLFNHCLAVKAALDRNAV